jgi:CubicO group peptidase (beta-lactamase class C family)
MEGEEARTHTHRVLAGLLAIVAITGMAGQLFAQKPPSSQTSAIVGPVSPLGPASKASLTAEDLGTFLDGLVPVELQRENIAGAVVSVVKDGHVLFKKGYGYADVQAGSPVSEDDTLFRLGSISKLLTWTAVMQLEEKGKIDLDRDVNDYLDFKIPAAYSSPVTMRTLMTHTSGFEDGLRDNRIEASDIVPLALFLSTHIPQRVYPPATIPAYSNFGATLAGYIVERVSGMSFDEYIEKFILLPLGMLHTSFRQPLPHSLQPFMSRGYMRASEGPRPYEIVGAEPAGSLTSSANDISRFMLMHLQNGELDGVRILKTETAVLMHSRQFGMNPNLPGMCLGFIEDTRNGHRLIEHGGDLQYFHSGLWLIPDANVGFFVSTNSLGNGQVDIRPPLFNAFLDRYFPYAIPAAISQPSAVRDSRLVAGEYISSRRAVTTMFSFLGMLAESTVTALPDGTIVIDRMKDLNQVPKTWKEIGPLLYRDTHGQDLIGFSRDEENRLLLETEFPAVVASKVSLIDNKTFNLVLVYSVIMVFLATLLFWPLTNWLRVHYRQPLRGTNEVRRMRVLVRLFCAVDLLYAICWLVILHDIQDSLHLNVHFDLTLRALKILGWLGTLGTPVILYAVLKTWRAEGEWWLSHFGNACIAGAAIAFSWFLLHWHLLHLEIRY